MSSSTVSTTTSRIGKTTKSVPKTVKLNVGGKSFEVSRSLILGYPSRKRSSRSTHEDDEQEEEVEIEEEIVEVDDDDDDDDDDEDDDDSTMLSKLISDRWMTDPNSEVFIDRDGELFTHVLNYLRYGSIILPTNISIDTFIKDLDFYGIYAEKGTIRKENVSYQTTRQFLCLEEKVINKRRRIEKLTQDLKIHEKELAFQKKHVILSTKILSHYHENTSSKVMECKLVGTTYRHCICEIFVKKDEYCQKVLNEYLDRYGIQVVVSLSTCVYVCVCVYVYVCKLMIFIIIYAFFSFLSFLKKGWNTENCFIKLLDCDNQGRHE